MSALKRITQALCVTLFALFAVQALAQQRPSYAPAVDLATAKKIAAGAIAECQKNNWNVAVAIVDTHGFLVYFEKMDDTQTASALIAVEKAKTAAMFRRPSRVFEDVSAKRVAILGLTGAMPITGGVPIAVSGKTAGGVGVSGVTSDQDEQCAKAGLAAM